MDGWMSCQGKSVTRPCWLVILEAQNLAPHNYHLPAPGMKGTHFQVVCLCHLLCRLSQPSSSSKGYRDGLLVAVVITKAITNWVRGWGLF